VFLNYLLDCLPAAVLEFDSDEVRQLCVRTCIARNVRLEDHTDLTAEYLAERARINDAAAQSELLEVYQLFASEYDYRPVDIKTVPLGEVALASRPSDTRRLVHSYGAIQALDRLLAMVREDGLILASDYGSDQASTGDEFQHQRFSLATFVGVNFGLLQAYFGAGRCEYVEPVGDAPNLHSRLLGHRLSPNTLARFKERFGKEAAEALQAPVVKARECAARQQYELALGYYDEAMDRQPSNWVLACEAAQFLIFTMPGGVPEGIEMARLALALNPACSSEPWNILGDGLFEQGRYAEARSAFQRALEVNQSDVRAHYNLAWVHQREQNYAAALAVLAQALALDKTGQYRQRLMQKHSEVVAQQAQQHQQEYLRLVNLVSKYRPGGMNGHTAEVPPAAAFRTQEERQ
jgi:tetratricopeptide (TPR) repeat protein